MSEMNHAPEPWTLNQTVQNYAEVYDGSCYSVWDNCPHGPIVMKLRDMKRAVACVNALAGIQDPEAWVREAKEALRLFAPVRVGGVALPSFVGALDTTPTEQKP